MFETSWRRNGVRSESWVGEMDREAVSPVAGARSDAELVALARSGDESAWTTIVELHWRRVWSLSRIIVRDPDGAEQVAEETFRIVRERLATYRGGATLCAWIQSICRRRALDQLQRHGRKPREAPAAEARSDVERALGALEAEEREALLLTVAGYTPEELGRVLRVPAATIRSRGARARTRLLDRLDAGGAA
jgi:RNA polymerase sigma-70 factor (ECF subfamily)